MTQQAHDLLTLKDIKIRSRIVRNEEFWLAHEGASQSDECALTISQALPGLMCTILYPEALQHRARASPCVAWRELAKQRERHILDDRTDLAVWSVALDPADTVVEMWLSPPWHAAENMAIEQDATAIGDYQPGSDHCQGRLAGTSLSPDGEELARMHLK